ncbi:hypothetical protein Ahp1_06 [Aeromonas phage Ahp1]|uniref:Uncharacterized protein n=1 Tax=Aeromonas phage Ahp1 TaxID=1747286 RepID=A0A1S5Q897_9CAUD|nr:hypothetical protein HOS19_gp06 [Aeromonas phage Ahp1]ALP47725.1 hypothetical protein Ahp1_06 [Aeromonas phage Ahp1]
MKLVACNVTGGPAPLYRLKDAHTGITYPNLLTGEQISSAVVVEAASTFIAMRHAEQLRAQMAAIAPLAVNLFDWLGLSGTRTVRTCASKPSPEQTVPASERKLLLDKIEQLQRANAGLQERNDRQARIIQAVQGAVRGEVQ